MTAIQAEFPFLLDGVAALRAEAVGRFKLEKPLLDHPVLLTLAPLHHLAHAHGGKRVAQFSDSLQLQGLVPESGLLDLFILVGLFSPLLEVDL